MGYYPSVCAQQHFWQEVQRLIHDGAKRWCDVGGGAKPVLNPGQIERRRLDYVLLDASQRQLDRAPGAYVKVCADILDASATSELLAGGGPFDVVVSRWTAEHVADGRRFHEAIFQVLAPGGSAVHFFPTLYSLPFVANLLLPPALSGALLRYAEPGRTAKFAPHYKWCRGPTRRQLRRLQSVGYTVERYAGYFGHHFYDSAPPLHRVHRAVSARLVAHPLPALTSFALVVLRRPA
ncbi:MAG TPA: class I SAM-dependent methyltransferase [Solirubrobacteraceae bacterium]|nr:class I SAM-dependent methyltransferase [Solirubrobacteraceae bacterium]